MEKSLVTLRVLRARRGREHRIKFLRQVQRVAHPALCGAGVDAHTVKHKLRGGRVEVFIFQFTRAAAVHGVGKIRTEARHIELVRAAADLFVRRKGDANAAMAQVRMRQQILGQCQDFSDPRLIVRSKKRGTVRDDDIVPDIVRECGKHAFFNGNFRVKVDIAAGITVYNPRAHAFARCVGRGVHMGDKAQSGQPLFCGRNAAVNIAVRVHARVRNAHCTHFLYKQVCKRKLLFCARDLLRTVRRLRIKGNIPQKPLGNAFHLFILLSIQCSYFIMSPGKPHPLWQIVRKKTGETDKNGLYKRAWI